MPLYEYECQSCEHVFEELVRSNEKVACPKCQSGKLEMLFSVPARLQAASGDLLMSCNSTGTPCGPMCGRYRPD